MERVIITGERLMMSGILGGEKRIGGVNDLIDFEDWAGQSETSSVRCELPVQLNREHMHQLRCAPLTPLLPPAAVVRSVGPVTMMTTSASTNATAAAPQVTYGERVTPVAARAPGPQVTFLDEATPVTSRATTPDQLPLGMYPLIATGHP